MDFRYTDDEQDLIDGVKSVFDAEATTERLRAIVAGKMTADALWSQFAELGFLGLMAPETMGGLAQPLVVMAGVAEAAGYVALPEPLVELAGVVVPCLAEMGEHALLAKAINGCARIGVISPLKPFLTAADQDTHFVKTHKLGAALLNKNSVTLSPLKSIDPLRRLYKTEIQSEENAQVNMRGAILGAAQLVGVSQRMLDMAVAYSKDRQQFGQPIGAFQAIKHHAASIYTQIEFTRPLVQLAALQGGRSVHAAKVAAIDTAMMAAEGAIQLFGGMGYTFEVDLHFFMKRAWALCGEWGGRDYHMIRLEEAVFSPAAALGPGTSFTNQQEV